MQFLTKSTCGVLPSFKHSQPLIYFVNLAYFPRFAEADGEILFELGEVLGSIVEELKLATGFQPAIGEACFAHSVDDN